MWSAALDTILTTLRYLAPATLLTLFWGQQSFLFRILKHIDSAFRAIVFSSEEQKQSVLQWLSEAGHVKVEHLDTVWKHGWILCGVLDAALPGACAGHPPTRFSLKHAQAIADHYLGVEPVFSRQELEFNDSLSKHQEWKLATYLDRVREAIGKITPPVSKPTSQRTSPESSTQVTLDYIAKGSGLSAAHVNNKSCFKIYPTAQQALEPGEVTILIRGPKDTYGMSVIPPVLGKAQIIRQKLLGLQSKQTYTENALPITQGATYFRSYGKNDMNKTYYIPKTIYDIDITVDNRPDHVKVSYVVTLEGKYEISITSRGQSIVGSPYRIAASHNIVRSLEKDVFSLEHGEEIDIGDVNADRKVVLRIVDFVTEKMLLKENGSLEKISEDEAKLLMNTDTETDKSDSETHSLNDNIEPDNKRITEKTDKRIKFIKFSKVAQNVVKMNKVCKILNDIIEQKANQISNHQKPAKYICPRNQQDIPDIVNSTFSDKNLNPFILTESKLIVPESLSVSICTEKANRNFDDDVNKAYQVHDSNSENTRLGYAGNVSSPDSLEKSEDSYDEDSSSVGRLTPFSNHNPFKHDVREDFVPEKKLGTFVTSEYETNNSQNEETRESSIKIFIETNDTPLPAKNNPFVDTDIKELDRPKTPILKIISGEVLNRDNESVFIDPKAEEMLANEFINPFFMHQFQTSQVKFIETPTTDFIIGAPVSLPPLIRAPSPVPKIESSITDDVLFYPNREIKNADSEAISPSVFSTPIYTNLKTKDNTNTVHISSTFHSLESNLTETIDVGNLSTTDEQSDSEPIVPIHVKRDISPRKDLWDSAYVSIDDNNSSPDSNNNDNLGFCETTSKQKNPLSDNYGLDQKDIKTMGPAERELWQSCNELSDRSQFQEEIKPSRWDFKRPMFTPIIEESDRSISSGAKEITPRPEIMTKCLESDSVTAAFAELNDIYQEYFPHSEINSTNEANKNEPQSAKAENEVKVDKQSVKSASELVSDVMRRKSLVEGTISEVQLNVAESQVSQVLQDLRTDHLFASLGKYANKDEIQFGDKSHNNIVLEKKKYWDDKIRQIQSDEQSTVHLKKKRPSPSKQLKHDSLSKRRGKQIIKNFLNTEKLNDSIHVKQVNIKNPEIVLQESVISQIELEAKPESKLVEKWKKFWDEKVEVVEFETESIRSKSPKHQDISPSPCLTKTDTEDKSDISGKSISQVKQELPEAVFKAFETSPKRFFGTSRNHILNKIDTFSAKPGNVEPPLTEKNVPITDSGLVSSRISLFHKMTNSEPLPWARRKCQSLHNIYHRKESEKSGESIEKITTVIKPEEPVEAGKCDSGIKNNLKTDSIVKNIQTREEKQAKICLESFNKSFDEPDSSRVLKRDVNAKPRVYIQKIPSLIKYVDPQTNITQNDVLRRKSFSKSEMDIFTKIPQEIDDGLDKYKSCDELPKANVKGFISLYENVTKAAVKVLPVKRMHRTSSMDSQKHLQNISTNSDAECNVDAENIIAFRGITSRTYKHSETLSVDSTDIKTDIESTERDTPKDNKESIYLSLSDIELEIVESSPEKTEISTPENPGEIAHIDYKNRFKMAKNYFQSLEELREENKTRKPNECEMLLYKQSTESPEIEIKHERPQKRVKKNIKSHSMPSSEISKYWNELQESQKNENEANCNRLVKISEKFNVDDLFTDVMEGRLSRQGSLRGIPHKKAVLEAFRSMENIATPITSYDMVNKDITELPQNNRGTDAQNYLSEYPYLPTTDPSKYHSRFDAKASGLITLKELKEKKRRNSVPDLRLNAKFTVDL